MKKFNFDIEICESKKICGGYLLTLENRTKKQIAKEMEKLGRELLNNDRNITSVGYHAWETDPEDYETCAFVYVFLVRHSRKISVYVDLD